MRTVIRHPLAFLGAMVALAAVLRIVGLGRDDLWSDEIHTLQALDGSALEIVRERWAAGHLPLYFLGMDVWTDLFGTSQFALRLPSALMGAALLIPAHALIRGLSRPATADAFALLLALHPLLIELSREARMYPLELLLLLVVAESTVCALRGECIPVRFWIALLLGPLVHASWGFGLPAIAAFVAADRARASRRVRGWLLAGMALSAALLLIGLLVTITQQPELTRRPWPREVGVFVLRLVAGAGVLDRWLPFYLVLFPAWTLAAILGFLDSSRRVRILALLLILVPVAVCVLAELAAHTPIGPVRYVQVSSVGIAILAAAGLRRRPVAVALVVLVLVGLAVRFVPARTSWSDAAREIDARWAGPVVVPNTYSQIQLEHYLGRPVHLRAPPPGPAPWWRAELGPDGRVALEEGVESPER